MVGGLTRSMARSNAEVLPGKNTVASRLHSSSHLHCQTLHNNLVLRTTSLNVSSQRTRIRLRQPILRNRGRIVASVTRHTLVEALEEKRHAPKRKPIIGRVPLATRPLQKNMRRISKNVQGVSKTYLMCSTDQIHVMFLQESRYDVGAKGKRYTSIVF